MSDKPGETSWPILISVCFDMAPITARGKLPSKWQEVKSSIRGDGALPDMHNGKLTGTMASQREKVR